jgi:hypothetical protein
MNDCNRDVHERCNRSFQAAHAAANVDINELMRPGRESCTEQGQPGCGDPAPNSVSPPIRYKNRPPLASEVSVRQLLRTFGDRCRFPPNLRGWKT